MLPHGGPSAAASDARIFGDFFLVGAETLGAGPGFVVESGFTASLDGVPVRVAWLGPHELSAQVPAGLADGTYALTVRGPTGMGGTLQAAWITSEAAPAQLGAVASIAPSQVSVGQAVQATLAVHNAGGSTAQGVLPALAQTGPGQLAISSAPSKADIAPGATVSFAWALQATTPGASSVVLSGTGADAVTGLPVAISPLPAGNLLVQSAANLSATASASPAQASVGQTIAFTMTIANSGDATAIGVAPAVPTVAGSGGATLATSPMAQDIPGHGSRGYAWTFTATSAGTLSLLASAAGTDANSGAAVPCPAATATANVQTPPSLSGALSGPPIVNLNDTFTIALTVQNGGEATATLVAPSAFSSSAPTAVQQQSGPIPANASIAGGSSQMFTWTFKAVAVQASPGVSFSSSASGTDANSSQPLPAAASASAAVQVQTPATLSANVSMPAWVQPGGSSFMATLKVTNTGAATANGVTPAAPTLANGNTGTATLSSQAWSPPGPVTLASGASQAFSWTYSSQTAGIFGIVVGVSGTDATDGASRTATARGSTQIGQVVQIAGSAQYPGTLATTFSSILTYQDQIWLGPSGDGSGAVRASYDGSNPAPANFSLEWDPGSVGGSSTYAAARNPSWSTTSPATTIGYLNCAQSTTACGPDNEAGRGLFFSGVLNGVEWLVLTGANPTGGTRFLYMSNAAFPTLPGPPVRNRFAYLSLEKHVDSTTTAATSGLAFENNLYLGSSDNGTLGSQGYTAPVLTRIITTPSLPGLNAVPGTDAVDLAASLMPGIGVNGNPANPLRGTSSTVLVDTIAAFGAAPNDALYIANNGGWVRSINNNPSACVSTGSVPCPDWVVTTPSSTNYTLKTSVTVPISKTSDFEPQDKAVPAMVAFGGRLYAARNTTLGPQLWSCIPSQDMTGTTTGNLQCGPNDWSLVAPNSALTLDAGLTQMNSNYTAISLLAAAGGYLYVGFNNTTAPSLTNPNPGIGLYRTNNPAATSVADFTGAGGCSPTGALLGPPCQGIGGTGLGQTPALTHIFDGKALTFRNTTYLYLSAGTGTATPGIFRVAP